jgi:hypothetical protein
MNVQIEPMDHRNSPKVGPGYQRRRQITLRSDELELHHDFSLAIGRETPGDGV